MNFYKKNEALIMGLILCILSLHAALCAVKRKIEI